MAAVSRMLALLVIVLNVFVSATARMAYPSKLAQGIVVFYQHKSMPLSRHMFDTAGSCLVEADKKVKNDVLCLTR